MLPPEGMAYGKAASGLVGCRRTHLFRRKDDILRMNLLSEAGFRLLPVMTAFTIREEVALTWRDGLELAAVLGSRRLGGVVLAEGGGPVSSGNQRRLL